MVQEVHHGVEIDRCTSCQALWFDLLEIQEYLRNRTNGSFRTPSDHDLRTNLAGPPDECPRCAETQFFHGEFKYIQFQRCTACGGILIPTETIWRILNEGRISVELPEPAAKSIGVIDSVGLVLDGGEFVLYIIETIVELIFDAFFDVFE
jgi:Zn-finger nucleic acid-binding protein